MATGKRTKKIREGVDPAKAYPLDEAVKMADRIAIFRAGRLVQCAAPDAMLAHPADDFVASFVGSDRTLKRLRLIRVREVMAAADGLGAGGAPTVMPEDDLRRVAQLFLMHDCEALSCVDADGRVVGRVTRAAVAARLALEPLP